MAALLRRREMLVDPTHDGRFGIRFREFGDLFAFVEEGNRCGTVNAEFDRDSLILIKIQTAEVKVVAQFFGQIFDHGANCKAFLAWSTPTEKENRLLRVVGMGYVPVGTNFDNLRHGLQTL
jgi:hypothetical protein